jgi:arylsulfatase A-like enzyme
MGYGRMTRRSLLRRLLLAGPMVGGALLQCDSSRRLSRTPNVVLIISDDQGWADYGFMGHPRIRTPNLDRLASESVTFTRGYVAAPVCCPSLASMVTGLHPHQHRMTCNPQSVTSPSPCGSPKPGAAAQLQGRERMIAPIDAVPTLPRLLGELGYLSLQTGKWWAGHYRRGGFTHGMTHGDPRRGGWFGDAGLCIGRDTMQPIYDFLEEAGSQRFFLWYSPMMPHRPHIGPGCLKRKRTHGAVSRYIDGYWAMCEWFDETCGQLLDHLEATGRTRDTLVLYVADNGWIQPPDGPGPAPRSKRSSYEGGIRTPIMLRWPGQIAPRLDRETPVSSIDLTPTVLAASGLQPTSEMQGVNLLDTQAVASRQAIFGATYSPTAADLQDPAAALWARWVIEGWWKLIVPEPTNPVPRPPELYNLENDPTEKRNLASERPGKVRRLCELLDAWYTPQEPGVPDAPRRSVVQGHAWLPRRPAFPGVRFRGLGPGLGIP